MYDYIEIVMIETDLNKELEKCRDHFFKAAYMGKNEVDQRRIHDAYEFGALAHSGQKRKSGHPYFIHPVGVATIVAEELHLGADPIIAALLHDVVEDTPYTIEDIKVRFGDDVAFLVDAVTKKQKSEYDMTKQLDNFRQMLYSINYDVRALLIKLADRLNNMRTLESMRPDKQMKIAGETDYFYAPLANRLGLYVVKSELENLSLKFRTPYEYAELRSKVMAYERENKDFMDEFQLMISKRLEAVGIKAYVRCQTRSVYAIWRKMQVSGKQFRQIEAIQVVNVVFENQPSRGIEKKQCLEIYSLLTDIFKEKPGSLVNYVDTPKENGYQALHFKLMGGNGQWIEMHVGSVRMANNSELGCIAEGEGSEHWVENFKEVLREIAAYGKEDDCFIENVVCNFYNDDITVFTPKGQAIVLPKGATALDFAYNIHTSIGHKAVYARVNGMIVPVQTVLNRGDRVEIGTREGATPHRSWLDIVKSFRARKAIQAWFRKYDSEHKAEKEFQRCPLCLPLPGEEVIGFEQGAGKAIMLHKRNCADAISRSAKFGDSIVSVRFKSSDQKLYPVYLNIVAVDREKILYDLIKVISIDLGLNIVRLDMEPNYSLSRCKVGIMVHSINELSAIIACLSLIDGVEEVTRV